MCLQKSTTTNVLGLSDTYYDYGIQNQNANNVA